MNEMNEINKMDDMKNQYDKTQTVITFDDMEIDVNERSKKLDLYMVSEKQTEMNSTDIPVYLKFKDIKYQVDAKEEVEVNGKKEETKSKETNSSWCKWLH